MKKSVTRATFDNTFWRNFSLNGKDFRQARASAGRTYALPEILVQGSGVIDAAAFTTPVKVAAVSSKALTRRSLVDEDPDMFKLGGRVDEVSAMVFPRSSYEIFGA